MTNSNHTKIEADYVILESARKHGISDEDMIHVFNGALAIFPDGDEAHRWLYVGFDIARRTLEVVTVEKDECKITFIHAMKATKTNLRRAGFTDGKR